MNEWKNGVVVKPITGMCSDYKVGELIRFKAEKIHVNVKVPPTVTVENRDGMGCIVGVPLRHVAEEVVECPVDAGREFEAAKRQTKCAECGLPIDACNKIAIMRIALERFASPDNWNDDGIAPIHWTGPAEPWRIAAEALKP